MDFVAGVAAIALAMVVGGVAWIEFAPGVVSAIGGLFLVNVGLLGLTWPLW